MPQRRRTSQFTEVETEFPSLLSLWMLRLLVPLNGQREFVQSYGFQDDSIAALLGLGRWIEPSCAFDPRAARADLRNCHEKAEREICDSSAPRCLRRNVARLAALVGLTEVDSRILEFAVMIHGERALDDVADSLGALSSLKVIHALAVLLELPEAIVRASLDPKGPLSSSGILSLERCGTSALRSKLTLLSDAFADHVLTSDADPVSLLRDVVAPSSAGHLVLSDFDYLEQSLQILRPYLRQSLSCGRIGMNILLYGVPGTGKNQLVKALAAEVGCELFEVASEDSVGDPVFGSQRLRALRAAQKFLTQHRAILFFDEVEDVFSDGGGMFMQPSTAQRSKAWINRVLEENTVPTFWVSNSIRSLDPAFIRRFDLVIEVPVPPKKQRELIIRHSCPDILDARGVARLAESEALAPAVVTRVASVVRSVSDELGAEHCGAAVERLIANTLEAQGHPPLRKDALNHLPETYDPELIHTDVDLAILTAGLQSSKSGKLCLFGPPGTGKTAFGRWLAEQLGVPLHVKRASDLMSKWVGENEKNIAEAFRRASQDGALLLIDEVDSFLQDRRGAQQSWEVRLVNEMLTQMESFDGVLIASTNLMDGLDQASLRRFDLKVKFDYLRPAQAWSLLRRHCESLGFAPPETALRPRLTRLAKLTPGDFAAVARQGRFRSLVAPIEVIAALEAECAIKAQGHSQPIGFV